MPAPQALTVGAVRVLLVEDDPVFRLGLRVVLNAGERMQLVAEASEGEVALELCRSLNPDVVLLDVGLPGAVGAEQLLGELAGWPQRPRVLALSSHTDARSVQGLVRAGVDGYCVKGIEPEALLCAIEQVHRGHSFFDGKVIDHLRTARGESRAAAGLTPREQEVLSLLARGLSNQQIGKRLYISVGTVQVHVHSLLRKLGVRDRTQAVILALEQGWVETD